MSNAAASALADLAPLLEELDLRWYAILLELAEMLGQSDLVRVLDAAAATAGL